MTLPVPSLERTVGNKQQSSVDEIGFERLITDEVFGKNSKNLGKLMKIYKNLWRSMKIFGILKISKKLRNL